MRKRATICLGFSAAVFVCQYLLPGAAWIYGAAAALLLAGICALVLREYARLRAVLMLLGLCAGFLVNGFYMQTVYMPAAAMDGYSGNITATAIAYPESTEYGSRIMVRLNTEGRHNAKTTLFCYDNHGDTADIRPGDIISVPAEISIANTIGGEETDYYSSRGIFLTASARGQLQITHLDKTPVKYLPAVVCQAVKEKLAQIYDGSQLGFMQAILTGDKSLINDDTPLRTRLNTVGLSHVIAISGMHVSFLTGFLAMVIPNRRRFAAVAIPVLIFFAMMVGGAPSVVRACFMQTMLLIAPLVRRESDSVTSLSTVLAVLLFANPFSAKNVGLQLSFAATAGILLLSERLIKRMLSSAAVKRAEKALPRPLRIRRGTGRNPLVYFICASIATSVGAIIFTCPLSALYFDYISLIAPLSNLLCLWAVTAIFVVGIFTVLLGFIWLPLALGVSVAVKILLMYLFIAVKILAKFPWAAAYTENRYIVYWMIFLYASVAALLFVKEK